MTERAEMPLALAMAPTVVRCRTAMPLRVSPLRTVYAAALAVVRAAVRDDAAVAAAPRTVMRWPGWMKVLALRWLVLSSEASGTR